MPDQQEWSGTYLADPADLAEILGTSIEDRGMLRDLRRASGRFREAVNHRVSYVENDTVTVNGTGAVGLRMPAAPILDVSKVLLNDTEVTDYKIASRTGLLLRTGGWESGIENVQVTYSHGYKDIPEGIQDVILEAAEIIHDLKTGVGAVTTASETVTFLAALAAGGASQTWESVVEKYRLGDGSDRA